MSRFFHEVVAEYISTVINSR